MKTHRKVIFVCCDGLGRNWVQPAFTPTLHRLSSKSLWCANHRAVFPSVTRVSAASIATGCEPGHHGLHGNRMGLVEAGRIVVRDVGAPDFRAHMRQATGRTLNVPTIAERVTDLAGFVAFSNVSPGAAYFLDPEHFGFVYHRAGSYAPGGAAVSGSDALKVSHDLAGDWDMTQRFCSEVLEQRKPSVAMLWLANPDLTLHGAPLGSPAHIEAMKKADLCVQHVVQTVADLRANGEDIMLLLGSDHGQETIAGCVDLEAWLSDKGLLDHLNAGDVAVASQGTAALLYATDKGRDALVQTLDLLQGEPWVDEVETGGQLTKSGFSASSGIVAAVNMARSDDMNPYGVRGQRWTVAEPGKASAVGDGQHGGWGPDETRPFLLINHPAIPASVLEDASSLVDIAPTCLAYLALPIDGMDGKPLVTVPETHSRGPQPPDDLNRKSE